MTEQNQKILYDHFISIADNVKKDHKNRDFKPLIRENCAKYAAEILKSFPQFADSKNKEPEEPAEKGDSKPKVKAKKAPKGT